MHLVPFRYLTFIATAAIFVLSLFYYDHYWLPLLAGALTLLGISDMLQTKRALRRNYPILAHFRFFESIRPEIRQYFRSTRWPTPFSRNQRSIVYQRAKEQTDKRPFGTQLDMYRPATNGSTTRSPRQVTGHDFRIEIGNHPDCPRAQPYSASVFNISAMSFGALSANAILALNGARAAAASCTTPAKAASAPTTAKTAATWSGKSARAISAAATRTARSPKSASSPTPAPSRSR
jgi:hypothetical protein